MSDNMSTTGNCTFDTVDEVMHYLEPIIYIPIFLSGLILNAAALYVFCFGLRKWTESTIYMTSLVLMDLLLILPIPFKIHATHNLWPVRLQSLCSFLESLYFVGIYGSIYTIVCIAVDRWVGICYPFKAKQLRSLSGAVGTCVAVWVLVLVVLFPTTHNFRKLEQREFHCFHGFSNGWKPELIISVEIFGFLLPAVVLIYCSIKSIYVLEKSGQQSPHSQACVKIIYSSMVAFLVPLTPSHFAIFLQFLVHQKVIQNCNARNGLSLFLQITLCLSNITCCLHAFCYYFIAREVRSRNISFRWSVTSLRRITFSTSEPEHGI